ncbi:MAG: alanine racemase [Ignavibacteria bacterium]|nr:alanine racemase [Ignavibacteria bacterium]
MRPTYAEINLSNLRHNYLSIAKKVGKNVHVMPVVKANSYGHGMIECVKALRKLNPKPEYFGVALLEEAIEFRNVFKSEKLLVFGKIDPEYFKFIINQNITPTFYELDQIEDFSKVCNQIRKIGKFHLKVDTGMGRVGVNHLEAEDYINWIKKQKNIFLEGIYTHFATSDARNKNFAFDQLEKFKKVRDIAKKEYPRIKYFHTSNSGAILDLPESYYDMVRPGISLYGYYPSDETTESVKLKPVMSLKTRISYTKSVEKGASISYGRIYTTDKQTNIATLPIGYADGYNRLLSNIGKAIIKNKIYNVVGRVCMDQIMIDLGDDNISNKEEVILIGSNGSQTFNATDISRLINTIPYEVCTSITSRVPRIYIY